MRFAYFSLIALLPMTAAAASACGGTVTQAQGSGTGGSTGGSGGSATTTITTSTSTVKDAGSDVNNGMVSTTYPAPHPAPPAVVTGGGTTLSAPKLVPVVFMGDSYQAQLTDFAAKVGTGAYWTATTSEYGVGPATGEPAVVLTETAPTTIDDSAIQTWLAGKLNGNDPAWPASDGNTIYILHYPSSTTITMSGGGQTAQSCQDFGGYHDSITLDANHNSQNTPYAVVPRCESFGPLHGIDAVTGAESHELIEASTDPFPSMNTAFGQVDNNHIYWEFALGGGEVGDMCAQFPGVFTKFSALDYTVQRTWSNASAKAGHDPCVPMLPGEVYFNSAPVLPDTITLGVPGAGSLTFKGVKIAVGASKTIDLDLFSDGDTGGPWDVEVQDFAQLMGQTATMGFSLDRNSGQNGEILHLTINVLKQSQYGAGIFLISSSLGQYQNWWIGIVGN